MSIIRSQYELSYEDYDRVGTYGASRTLAATDENAAIVEALQFLTENKTRLPRQTHVTVNKKIIIDIGSLEING